MRRTDYCTRHALCKLFGMKDDMSKQSVDLARALEKECETWDWARAAGVSAQDLRMAVLESLGQSEDAGYRIAEAA